MAQRVLFLTIYLALLGTRNNAQQSLTRGVGVEGDPTLDSGCSGSLGSSISEP